MRGAIVASLGVSLENFAISKIFSFGNTFIKKWECHDTW